ncbi:MAG: putative surface protein with fasciclin (FAS1) repeats [Paraglaciecola sp.]|jgi:uncharacterized surface protein with fasciclin (FAS1) repeats
MKNLLGFLMLATLTIFSSCADSSQESSAQEPVAQEEKVVTSEAPVEKAPTIVGVAAGSENFSTLVAAVKAADLVSVLNSDGPFTVFAPTNAAFAKLPEGTVASLLEPESKETLTAVLTYHVVKGIFKAADVVGAINANNGSFTVETVQGGKLTASLNEGKVVLTDIAGNTSTVVIADVEASNGIIHAIDSVVMPK